MSDFEQDFMSQVKTEGVKPAEGVVQNTTSKANKEKKSIDKRWFVLAGLVLALIVVIVLIIVTGNGDKN